MGPRNMDLLPSEIISLILLHSCFVDRSSLKIALGRRKHIDPWTLPYDEYPDYLDRLGYEVTEKENTKQWRLNGILHRVGGPALTYSGDKEDDWWESWRASYPRTMNAGPIVYTREEWYQNGEYHRLDGPAVISNNSFLYGVKIWCQRGKLHRLDGPAVDHSNGRQEWHQNGELHRIDGPAIKTRSEQKWYQNGELHRVDGPAVISQDVEKWYQNGRLHRLDGPAFILYGRKEWHQNDILHREEGPAIICPDGIEEWYWNGNIIARR